MDRKDSRAIPRLVYTVTMPVSPETIALRVECERQAGWVFSSDRKPKPKPKAKPTPKAKPKPHKGRQRGPQPLPAPVFGNPANGRQCRTCHRWFDQKYFWHPPAFVDNCPKCAAKRRF